MRPDERCDLAVTKLADPTLTPRGLSRAVVTAACALEECRELLTAEKATHYEQLIDAASRRAARFRDVVAAMQRLGRGLPT